MIGNLAAHYEFSGSDVKTVCDQLNRLRIHEYVENKVENSTDPDDSMSTLFDSDLDSIDFEKLRTHIVMIGSVREKIRVCSAQIKL